MSLALVLLAAGCSGDGEACSVDKPCPGNEVCFDGKCHQPCNDATECEAGLGCRQGLCMSCTVDDQCANSHACDVETGRCHDSCKTDDQCSSGGYCASDGVCTAKEAPGTPCAVSSQCVSGNCLGSVCCPEGCTTGCLEGVCLLGDGEACNDDSECFSTFCVDRTCCASRCDSPCETCFGLSPGVCEIVSEGSDRDACSTVCNAGVCLGAVGDPCSLTTDCASDSCADGYCCDADCESPCQTCAQTGSEGTCVTMTAQQFEACSFGPDGAFMCDAEGGCVGPHAIADVASFTEPQFFVELRGPRNAGRVLFVMNASGMGRELWVYDSHEKEAKVVADIRPGPQSSEIEQLTLSTAKDVAYFVADNGANGRELWMTDGVSVRMLDLRLGPEDGSPYNLVPVGDWLYFTLGTDVCRTNWQETFCFDDLYMQGEFFALGNACFFEHQNPVDELVRIVGNETTWTLIDVNPTAGHRSGASILAVAGSNVFFTADNGEWGAEVDGVELWRADTSTDTPTQVKDICPGTCDGFRWPGYAPPALVAWSQGMAYTYFVGHDGTGFELWVTDGSETGTVPVTDVADSEPTIGTPVVLGNTAYFGVRAGAAETGLYATTIGSSSSTLVQTTANAPGSLLAADTDLYFTYDDGEHGVELGRWRQSQLQTLDLHAGPEDSQIVFLGSSQGRVYFVATTPAEGQAVWMCENSVAELSVACRTFDPMPGPASSYVSESKYRAHSIILQSGELLFGAIESERGPYALWTATNADTAPRRVAALDYGERGSSPRRFSAGPWQNWAFFAADDAVHGEELWLTDGTAAGTHMVIDINPNGNSMWSELVRVGDGFIFSADDGDGARYHIRLWTTDGSSTNTRLLKDVHPGYDGLSRIGDQCYFAGSDGSDCDGNGEDDDGDGVADEDHCEEIWVSDGSEAGTRMLRDIHPTGGGDVGYLTAYRGYAYFSANDGEHGGEIWSTNGEDVQRLTDLSGDGTQPPYDLTVSGDRLYFFYNDGVHTELYVTTCVAGATCSVASDCSTVTLASPGVCKVTNELAGTGSRPARLYGYQGLLYFLAYGDAYSDAEPWISDGTELGTRLLADLNPGDSGSFPDDFVGLGGRVYFTAERALRVYNPATDTLETLYRNADHGSAYAGVCALTPFQQHLFFCGATFDPLDDEEASELLVTDGTAAGTRPACPPGECLNPGSLELVGGRLYMSLDFRGGPEPAVFP